MVNTIIYAPTKRTSKKVGNKSRYSLAHPSSINLHSTSASMIKSMDTHTMTSLPQPLYLSKFGQHLSDQVRSSVSNSWTSPQTKDKHTYYPTASFFSHKVRFFWSNLVRQLFSKSTNLWKCSNLHYQVRIPDNSRQLHPGEIKWYHIHALGFNGFFAESGLLPTPGGRHKLLHTTWSPQIEEGHVSSICNPL